MTAVNGCKFKRTSSLDWVYIVSIRPDYKNVTGDVTLRVKGSQHARYGIKWLNTEYVKTDIPEGWQPNVLPEESIDGEQVGAQFYTIDGYYLDSVSSNIDGLELQCIARSAVLFEMPASDVEISLNFKKKRMSLIMAERILHLRRFMTLKIFITECLPPMVFLVRLSIFCQCR